MTDRRLHNRGIFSRLLGAKGIYIKNIALEYKCDYRTSTVPELLSAPDKNDYLTDDESDDMGDFELKIPELGTLIDQFEKDDEAILEFNENMLQSVKALEVRGFEPEPRHQIVNQ